MVTLAKPVVPLSPVTVKESVVVDVDWLVVSVVPVICVADMLPFIERFTVAPLLVVAAMICVWVGLGVAVGLGVGVVMVMFWLLPLWLPSVAVMVAVPSCIKVTVPSHMPEVKEPEVVGVTVPKSLLKVTVPE